MTLEPRSTVAVQLTVNGITRRATVAARVTAAELLRDHLGLSGTHTACEHGVCGSCTVLVDGASARSCLMFAAQLDGRSVTTVEGLCVDDELNELQNACVGTHAFQCGFCTPGVLMVVTELLAEQPGADEPAIREALSGNACRCTGYESIVEAVLQARR